MSLYDKYVDIKKSSIVAVRVNLKEYFTGPQPNKYIFNVQREP